MPRARKVVEATRSEAKLYLAKAEEFLEEARTALAESRFDAAILNAVHAAISAADAATAASAGVRSADPDHQRAADLLEEVAHRSSRPGVHIGQLRKLLSKKNVVEYFSRRATAKESKEEVVRPTDSLVGPKASWSDLYVASSASRAYAPPRDRCPKTSRSTSMSG